MIDLTGVVHHPAIEEIAEVLANKLQNTDRSFFRTEAAYFLAKMASSMRAMVITKDRGEIPVNLYALLLATSGFGKGHSISIMEDEFLFGFHRRFMDNTFPQIAEKTLWTLANKRAARNGTPQQEEFNKAEKEFQGKGAFPFTFDSGTIPAVKQLREKLLLGGAGAINFQVDEIGLNLMGSTDVLTVFLELFDQGKTKVKLTKSTADNQRGEDLIGKTPANMLLFGAPSKLLDGGQTEDLFYSFLETGYARRCLFGYGQKPVVTTGHMSDAEIAQLYQRQIAPSNSAVIAKWSNHFHKLADPAMFGWQMKVEDDVAIKLLTYKVACERAAEKLKQHEELQKAELEHRYFKVLKIAGALAFVDESSEVEIDHLMSAILLVEEAGSAFQKILTREKSYVRLAKYMADADNEVTQSDLLETLPFYKGPIGYRNDMMNLAMAWGYPRHIVIKKRFQDGIEFFKGETLNETNLDEVIVSYSDNFAYGYESEKVAFDQLHMLTGAEDMHWCNHHFRGGHRHDDNAIPGFNLVVVDCDGEVSLDTVHDLLKDYKFLTATTKRHTAEANRFRLILPINYTLELDQEEYREFMNSVLAWLPFKTDPAANQRAKKWMSCHTGTHHYNDGKLFDALDFIPRTKRNETFQKEFQALESLDNLERWFAQRMVSGNRNNHMIRYALCLVENGLDLIQVQKAVHAFNDKLSNPLTKDEIDGTILVTVGKRLAKTA